MSIEFVNLLGNYGFSEYKIFCSCKYRRRMYASRTTCSTHANRGSKWKQTAQPCYDYFRTEVMNHPSINLYRAARLANPEVMKNSPKNAAAVREAVRPLQPKLLSNELLERMIEELADYQIACITINWESYDISEKNQSC